MHALVAVRRGVRVRGLQADGLVRAGPAARADHDRRLAADVGSAHSHVDYAVDVDGALLVHNSKLT